jgi:DNA-binding GntR family transcriptional regulator
MSTSAILQPIVISKAPRYREIAYAAIKDAILAGQLGPNKPLVEEQIAASLAISRTPVREALAILEHEGLIEPRNGRGLYVCMMTRSEFVAIFVANETVEPHLVRRAALFATPAQLEQLSGTITRARQSAADHDSTGFLRASRDFHRLVGEASGNLPLTEFVLRNEERTDMFLISAGKVIDSANMSASNREHAAILGAMAERDPEAAARLAVYHAQSLRERFAEHFNTPNAVR